MPLYNFQVRTSEVEPLIEDVELPDCLVARAEATSRIGGILQKYPNQLWDDKDWQIQVSDETGLLLYVIQVVALNSAATMSQTE